MSLKDRLSVVDRVRRCRLKQIMDDLPSTDGEFLGSALADRRYSSREITAALRAEGHQVGRTVVQEHRSGTCCCGTV